MRYVMLLGLSLFCMNALHAQKVSHLISKDSTKATYTVLNNNSENSKKTNIAIGIAFVQVQYFNCNKFVVDLTASGYGGIIVDYYHCFKIKNKLKKQQVLLGHSYEGSKNTFYYTNDSVPETKMKCFHVGVMFAPLILGQVDGGGTYGVRAKTAGLRVGYGRFKVSVNKYKSKAHEFNLKAEKTYRKGANIDLVYFPVFSYTKPTQAKAPDYLTKLSVKNHNVLGLLFCFHGSRVRCYEPNDHQIGIAWRLGAGATSNGNILLDFGIGFAF